MVLIFMHIAVLTEPKGYSEKAIATLKRLGSVYPWSAAVKKPNIMRMADILVVKLGMQISRSVMNRFPNLKIIATSTTGLNHIDLKATEERGTGYLSTLSYFCSLAFSSLMALSTSLSCKPAILTA